jgi:hypothetical protein
MCSTDELRMRGLDGTTQKNPPSSFRLLEAAASGNRISSICLLSLSLVCVWVLDGRPLTPGQRTAASLVVCSISFYFFFYLTTSSCSAFWPLSAYLRCVLRWALCGHVCTLLLHWSWQRINGSIVLGGGRGGLKGVSTILISYNLCFLFFNGDLQLGLAQQS